MKRIEKQTKICTKCNRELHTDNFKKIKAGTQRGKQRYRCAARCNDCQADVMLIKICCSCKKELPRTDKYFRRRSDYKNNFRSDCKNCYDEKQRKRHIEFYKNNTEKEKERHKYFYYRNPEYTKEKNRLARIRFKPKQVIYDKKRINDLTDSVIINRIVTQIGLKKEEIPKELIETKRLLTQLKRTLKNN